VETGSVTLGARMRQQMQALICRCSAGAHARTAKIRRQDVVLSTAELNAAIDTEHIPLTPHLFCVSRWVGLLLLGCRYLCGAVSVPCSKGER